MSDASKAAGGRSATQADTQPVVEAHEAQGEGHPPRDAPLRAIDVLTLFPAMFEGVLAQGVVGRAVQRGAFAVTLRDIRTYAEGRHRVTDDVPYGGGAGMVMKPEPLVAAIEASRAALGPGARVILLAPGGRPFRQSVAEELTRLPAFALVCGRYEGVDERVRAYVDDELSIGDYVLSGGEPAALCVVDAVARLLPGVLGNEESALAESFTHGLLEHPHYTRPPEFRGERVPDVLLSGDHARIARWRRQQALLRTRARRPDLFEKVALDRTDRALLDEKDAATS